MKDILEFCPKNQSEWREWLKENHITAQAVWLVLYKKSAISYNNLGWSEAVDEALCFGWIDSVKKSIDDERYKQYFSKRKAKSNWSKVNKEKIANLIEQNLMQAQGYKSIEVAKENGSWTILDSVENLEIPKDLAASFTKHYGAKAFFNSLSNSSKKLLLYKVTSAKREATRQKRIEAIAKDMAANKKPT